MPITIATGLMKYRNQDGTYEDINAVSYEAGVVTHICSSSEYDAVTRIPTVLNPESNVFYLVPAEDGSSPDMFVEWIYANNAWERFGNVTIEIPVQDVQVNGTSILSNGVANVPIASVNGNPGAVKLATGLGLGITGANNLMIATATDAAVKNGSNNYAPLTPSNQHGSTFYGLAKAAGDTTQSQSANAVGIYTDDAKAAIQTMLDVPSKSDIPEVPVRDVQVNGVSAIQNGILQFGSGNGFSMASNGNMFVQCASNGQVKDGTNHYRPITPHIQDASVFYGLAKAAGDSTQSQSANAVGTYTDDAKTAIQTMLDIPSKDDVLIKSPTFGTPEVLVDTTTLSFHKDGDNDWYCTDENPITGFAKANFLYDCIYKVEWDGVEYEEFAVIYEHVTDSSWYDWAAIGKVEFLGNVTTYQSSAPFAIAYDYHRNAAEVQIFTEDTSATHTVKITKVPFAKYLPREQFYTNTYKNVPLIRAGTGNSSVILSTANDAKGNGSLAEGEGSIAEGNVSHAEGGGTLAKGYYSHAEGQLTKSLSNSTHAEGRLTTASGLYSHAEGAQTTASGHFSHSEGATTLASGQSSHAEGQITEATNFVAHAEGYDTKASGDASHVEGYQSSASGSYSHAEGGVTQAVGSISHAEGIRSVANGVASHVEGERTIANGRNSHAQGVYNIADSYDDLPEWTAGTEYSVGDKVKITTVSDDVTKVTGYECKTANSDATFTSSNWIISPLLTYADIVGNGTDDSHRSNAYALTWTGDGKYAGHVYVGANTDSSGGTMLPEDVQVNGTSIVQNGVANIPIASSTNMGLVKVISSYGIYLDGNDSGLSINSATSGEIKFGLNSKKPLTPVRQHEVTFYGLAKAAGDSTQSASDNAVGTYTAEAKAAIQSMLGIDLQSIANEVEIPLVETVSGTTPVITGQPNTRYNCGEVSTISITPPSVGSIDVIFDSGSTPAVITVPNTVRWPAWFDATTLEADTTYEILITDGVYGSVMTWPA